MLCLAFGRFTGVRVLLLHTGEDQWKILDLHFDDGPKMAFIEATYTVESHRLGQCFIDWASVS